MTNLKEFPQTSVPASQGWDSDGGSIIRLSCICGRPHEFPPSISYVVCGCGRTWELNLGTVQALFGGGLRARLVQSVPAVIPDRPAPPEPSRPEWYLFHRIHPILGPQSTVLGPWSGPAGPAPWDNDEWVFLQEEGLPLVPDSLMRDLTKAEGDAGAVLWFPIAGVGGASLRPSAADSEAPPACTCDDGAERLEDLCELCQREWAGAK